MYTDIEQGNWAVSHVDTCFCYQIQLYRQNIVNIQEWNIRYYKAVHHPCYRVVFLPFEYYKNPPILKVDYVPKHKTVCTIIYVYRLPLTILNFSVLVYFCFDTSNKKTSTNLLRHIRRVHRNLCAHL